MQASHTPTTLDKVLRFIMQPKVGIPLSVCFATVYFHSIFGGPWIASLLSGVVTSASLVFNAKRAKNKGAPFAFRAIREGRASVVRRYNRLLKAKQIPDSKAEHEDFRDFLKSTKIMQERNAKGTKHQMIFIGIVAVAIVIVTQKPIIFIFVAFMFLLIRFQISKGKDTIDTIEDLLHKLDQRALRN